jgi:hypothetical protein
MPIAAVLSLSLSSFALGEALVLVSSSISSSIGIWLARPVTGRFAKLFPVCGRPTRRACWHGLERNGPHCRALTTTTDEENCHGYLDVSTPTAVAASPHPTDLIRRPTLMGNVVWIKEWLHRQSMRRLRLYLLRNGGQCWYPLRQTEKGEWELNLRTYAQKWRA